MDAIHLHLVLNHFPLLLPMVGAVILVVALFIISDILRRTAYVLFIVAAMLGVASFITGEKAEEIIEDSPRISHEVVHEHEESVETFAVWLYVLGGVSLISFWTSLNKNRIERIFKIITLIISLITVFLSFDVGLTGGDIIH